MSTYKICVLFGGTGFIDTHFALYLLTNEIAEKVFLADLQPIERGARARAWVLARLETQGINVELFNFSIDPTPNVEEYVQAICRVAGVARFVPSVPYHLLLAASCAVEAVGRPLGINQPIGPVRIGKLVRSNNIVPSLLCQAGYQYQYTSRSERK